jgi:choline dehydrogenase-like flavoprotein
LADAPVDILIIGSGASGAAAAWRLSDAGFRIMCLEQGRWQKPEEYAPSFPDWEFRAARISTSIPMSAACRKTIR